MNKGFTLLEVVLSMVVASAILGAIIVLNSPFLAGFSEAFNFQRLRHQTSHPIETIQKEVASARAVYVDSGECYAVCLVDKATSNRIYYYWAGNDLLRKSEPISTAVACSDGQNFATGMDPANSGFTQLKELTTMKMAATGPNNIFYRLFSTVLPTNIEQSELFYENFACKSELGKGWTLDNTGTRYWAIEAAGGPVSAYSLRESISADVALGVTLSAEIPVYLGRASKAYLQFKYRTQGTLISGEYLTVNYFDGASWHEVFRDDLLGALSPLETTTINLDSFSLSDTSRIRIDGRLRRAASHWIIDEVLIVAK